MVEQIWSSPDIFTIPVVLPENPLRNLNSYVICTPTRNLIIDTGFNRPECREALWAGLNELDLDMSKTALFLTHMHSDHAGLVWDFVAKQVPVYISAIDHALYGQLSEDSGYRIMDQRFADEGFPQEELDHQFETNQARLYSPKKQYPAKELQHGDLLPLGDLKAVALHTPGHTPGHMVLYLPDQEILFSGDHILFDITPNIGAWPGNTHSLNDYLESLREIRKLPIRQTFPAHRAAAQDTHARIDALLAHHEERLEEICEAIRLHPSISAYDIARSITWNTRGLGWDKFPPHQRWFAMSETLSHLDLLLALNRCHLTSDYPKIRNYSSQ